ncbi:hypothetical protein HHK36_006013 [Tetracentron sinense]|uniref:Amine oxidase domain-containing protein n=1 Tax=Tetracentron sinense TaxID=13715 RepID=A0A835DNP9_TETSI|nr:hypothetical protein HHK36_006013 [Tetracentron sinense]
MSLSLSVQVKLATMVAKKLRIVIIGAGMAGLTAANKLYTSAGSKELFELCVVEGGTRIGGRIHTTELGGDQIEMGATWIHGIGGSPIYKIAQEMNSLESEQPWECKDGFSEDLVTIAEGGFELDRTIIEPISNFYKNLMDFARGGKLIQGENNEEIDYSRLVAKASKISSSNGSSGKLSIGSFLQQGLDAYWVSEKEREDLKGYGNWTRKLLEEAIFTMHENNERNYTSAGDLLTLDFNSESEYREFPDEEITIAKGYMSIIESLASVLPADTIQMGSKVMKIEWQPEGNHLKEMENGYGDKPVKLHFYDGSVMFADHVIVTVSLGVLKAGIGEDWCMFSPPLPSFKTEAISRLGFGVVNKLFMQLSPTHGEENMNFNKFPYLQMAFHQFDSKLRHGKIPWWMRKTDSLFPIYKNSTVLLSWFAGKEALELESLNDEEIINGVSTTVSSFLSDLQSVDNSNANSIKSSNGRELKFTRILKSQWSTNPLFLGSYSYVAVGSSGDDLDTMAEPLPKRSNCRCDASPPLQILFAGEATHRTHYSTTHGAYFSGLREADRLLKHYHCGGFSELLHH